MDNDVKEKKTLPNGEKKEPLCNLASLHSIRGQHLAAVVPYVRRQVGTELLVLGGIESLTPCIEDSNHTARGGLLLSIHCRGRVSDSVSGGREAAAVADAAARCSTPGGSSAAIV